eukprot:g3070.t1
MFTSLLFAKFEREEAILAKHREMQVEEGNQVLLEEKMKKEIEDMLYLARQKKFKIKYAIDMLDENVVQHQDVKGAHEHSAAEEEDGEGVCLEDNGSGQSDYGGSEGESFLNESSLNGVGSEDDGDDDSPELFQSSRKDLLKMRSVELQARERELTDLLHAKSNELAQRLEARDDLQQNRDFLRLTIQQLLERIAPGNVDITTGKQKNKNFYAKPNIRRKMFDSLL